VNRKDCFDKIVDALDFVKTIDRGQLSESSYVMDNLGLDSIDVLDFFFEVEKKMARQIDLSAPIGKERNPDFSIGDLIDYLTAKPGDQL
jgi:acyl carrier protein